jgi:UDP-3-O-acyl-N-acetylglucosamine deacetylase
VQTTIREGVEFTGVGLHSGAPAHMRILPAAGEYGIWFKRVDVDADDPMIPARYDAVSDTTLCTRLTNSSGVSVSTVEHVLAALAGCGVTNALIEIDGPEAPIMDGSSAEFEKILLTNRNKNWIPIMEEMILEKPTLFAVGAGHLGGPNGIIRLMIEKGYTLSPVSQTSN